MEIPIFLISDKASHYVRWRIHELGGLPVKRIAKARLGLNPYQPIISCSGRLVEEEAGRKRAFTDENIEELVKAGAQVVSLSSRVKDCIKV